MAFYGASLDDDEFFLSWSRLASPSEDFFCFLGEIQQCDGFGRFRCIVKDVEGKEVVVAFYPDSYDSDEFDFKQLKRGHTLAIMNATQHQFLDGTHGVRVEEMGFVHVSSIITHETRVKSTAADKLSDPGLLGDPCQPASTARPWS